MKKLLLGTFALIAISANDTTLAADLPARVYKAPVLAPVYNWTGFYVGVNAGYGWDNNDTTVVSSPYYVNNVNFGNPALVGIAAAGGTASLSQGNNGGFVGGGQIGYNWQRGSTVMGIETDLQWLANQNKTVLGGSVLAAPNSPLVTNMSASQGLDWLGTLRGRLGITVTPNLLAYATGGLAYGEAKSNFYMAQSHVSAGQGIVSGTMTTSFSVLKAGWTLGGGLEWKIAQNWNAKAEYLYYDLGSESSTGLLVTTVPAGIVRYIISSNVSADYKGSIARVGLNYLFN